MKLVVPTILIVIAAGLFFIFTRPLYTEVEALRAQEATYNEALSHSEELAAIRDRLISSYNNLTTTELERIKVMLPDTIDNVRLVLDVDAVAARYGLTLNGLSFGGDSMSSSEGEDAGSVGTLTLNFNVETRYETVKQFLDDLQNSLRILDVTAFSFSGSDDDLSSYNITLQTYWLK